MIANGVYIIKNNINNKVYIGSSAGKTGIRGRIRHHKSALKHNRHINKHLQRSYNEYGSSAFSYKILEECKPEECITREQYYLDLYQSFDINKGYNICPTAGNTLGRKHSEETRLKIGKSRVYGVSPFKGKRHSRKSIENMSLAQKNSIKGKERLLRLNISRRIPVVGVNLVTGEVLQLKYAGEDSRFLDSGINMCCRGRIKHYKGYKWSYAK